MRDTYGISLGEAADLGSRAATLYIFVFIVIAIGIIAIIVLGSLKPQAGPFIAKQIPHLVELARVITFKRPALPKSAKTIAASNNTKKTIRRRNV
jgi:hypothetical protein